MEKAGRLNPALDKLLAISSASASILRKPLRVNVSLPGVLDLVLLESHRGLRDAVLKDNSIAVINRIFVLIRLSFVLGRPPIRRSLSYGLCFLNGHLCEMPDFKYLGPLFHSFIRHLALFLAI